MALAFRARLTKYTVNATMAMSPTITDATMAISSPCPSFPVLRHAAAASGEYGSSAAARQYAHGNALAISGQQLSVQHGSLGFAAQLTGLPRHPSERQLLRLDKHSVHRTLFLVGSEQNVSHGLPFRDRHPSPAL